MLRSLKIGFRLPNATMRRQMRCAPCHAVARLLQLRRRVLVWPSLPRRRLVRLDPHLKDPSHLFRRQYRALLRPRFASWTGPSAAPSRKQSANREPRVQHTHGGVDEQHGAVHRHKTVALRPNFGQHTYLVLCIPQRQVSGQAAPGFAGQDADEGCTPGRCACEETGPMRAVAGRLSCHGMCQAYLHTVLLPLLS